MMKNMYAPYRVSNTGSIVFCTEIVSPYSPCSIRDAEDLALSKKILERYIADAAALLAARISAFPKVPSAQVSKESQHLQALLQDVVYARQVWDEEYGAQEPGSTM